MLIGWANLFGCISAFLSCVASLVFLNLDNTRHFFCSADDFSCGQTYEKVLYYTKVATFVMVFVMFLFTAISYQLIKGIEEVEIIHLYLKAVKHDNFLLLEMLKTCRTDDEFLRCDDDYINNGRPRRFLITLNNCWGFWLFQRINFCLQLHGSLLTFRHVRNRL